MQISDKQNIHLEIGKRNRSWTGDEIEHNNTICRQERGRELSWVSSVKFKKSRLDLISVREIFFYQLALKLRG